MLVIIRTVCSNKWKTSADMLWKAEDEKDEPAGDWRACLKMSTKNNISSESDEPALNSHSKNANNDLVSQFFLHDNSNESYQTSSGKLIVHSISPISALVIPTEMQSFHNLSNCNWLSQKYKNGSTRSQKTSWVYQNTTLPGAIKPQIPWGDNPIHVELAALVTNPLQEKFILSVYAKEFTSF